jgi:2-aminomuconate deaminase
MTHGIHSQRAPKPVGLYPHARRVGNLLFLSGVGPRRPGASADPHDIPGTKFGADGKIASHDIEVQTLAVFDNVRAILEDAGSSWDRLIDVTVYLTDMQRDFSVYNRVWAERFATHPSPPCRTTVEVRALPTPIAIELKCIATVD